MDGARRLQLGGAVIPAALLVLTLAADASASRATEAAGAATAAAAPTAPGPVRVERRLLVKEKRWVIQGGAAYLARGDYYTSPGLALSAAYYPWESGGPELRLAQFFSSLDGAAEEVKDATGLVPDAQEPQTLLAVGWRQSFGYGKVLPFREASVLHFDFQGTGFLGLLHTDRETAPALGAGPALLVRMGGRAVAQLDVALLASFEEREHASVSFGFLTTLAFGARL